MKPFHSITRAGAAQSGSKVKLTHPDVSYDRAPSVRHSSLLNSRIIGLRVPEWELGIETFGAPLPRRRMPRPAADVAMFAPGFDVYQTKTFNTLSSTCDRLVYDAPYWFGAAGKGGSMRNWSRECGIVVLTGGLSELKNNICLITASHKESNAIRDPFLCAVTAIPTVLSPQDQARINWLRARVDLLINLDGNPAQAATGHDGCWTNNKASAKRLYNQVIDQLVSALTLRGLVCFDVADLRTCLGGAKRTYAAIQTRCGTDRAITAARMALATLPLGQRSIQKACGVFAIITGGADLSIREFDSVGRLVKGLTNQHATVIITAPVTYEDTGALTVSLLVASRR